MLGTVADAVVEAPVVESEEVLVASENVDGADDEDPSVVLGTVADAVVEALVVESEDVLVASEDVDGTDDEDPSVVLGTVADAVVETPVVESKGVLVVSSVALEVLVQLIKILADNDALYVSI